MPETFTRTCVPYSSEALQRFASRPLSLPVLSAMLGGWGGLKGEQMESWPGDQTGRPGKNKFNSCKSLSQTHSCLLSRVKYVFNIRPTARNIVRHMLSVMPLAIT